MVSMYDELKTQYSVMEAYSVKIDSKVNELEEILDSMESNLGSKPENDGNNEEEDTVQKLKTENNWLREVLIRATREEVANLKEDTTKIKPKDGIKDRLHPHAVSNDSIVVLPEFNSSEPKEERKSLKMSHSFIKRQNSTKKMLKSKVTKDNDEKIQPPQYGIYPHRREHSSSTTTHRSLTRKDVESAITSSNSFPQSFSDMKLPPLSSLQESKHHEGEKTTPRTESSTLRLPRLSLSTKPIDENSKILLSSRFEKIQHQTTFGPSPPHKGIQRTATISSNNSPKWTDGNIPGPQNPSHRESLLLHADKENMNINVVYPPKAASKMSLNEVVQKFHDFEKRIVVKEKVMECEQSELKKQMDDMKGSLDNLVSAFNHLSQKIIPS